MVWILNVKLLSICYRLIVVTPPPEKPAARAFAPRPVSKLTAAEQIAAQIRAAITQGELPAGSRLSEQELAAEFGVSRPTVREAVKLLAAANLVRSSRGAAGGTFVVGLPNPSVLAAPIGEMIALWFHAGSTSLAQVDEARATIEDACVRLAAERRTDADLTAIEHAIDDADGPDVDSDTFLALDLEFHVAISKAAKNPVLEMSMTAIHMVRPWTNTLYEHISPALILEQHRQILDALRAGDAEQAAAALTTHLSYLAHVEQEALASREAAETVVSALAEGEQHPSLNILNDRSQSRG